MIVVEHQRIELDHCLSCGGVWFDSGELELLIESMKKNDTSAVKELFTPVEADSVEKKRKCPICSKKMSKATICTQPLVLIDTCPRGEGLWFDSGELEQVVSQVTGLQCGKTQAEGVLSFLGDAFKAQKGPP